MLAPAYSVEQLALLVEDFDFHVAIDMAASLVVSDKRPSGTAGANESLVALRPPGVGIDVLRSRPAGDEGRGFRHQVGSQSTQRRNVVDDPDAAAVGRQHRSEEH